MRFGETPNVGFNGLPQAVPLKDGLGVTVAEARKQRNDPKGLLDLEPGRPGLDAFENCLSALVTLTQPRAALRGCTAWLDDKASGALLHFLATEADLRHRHWRSRCLHRPAIGVAAGGA